MQGAFALESLPERTGLMKLILDHLDQVQQIVITSKDDFNKLRVEKYRRRPF